MSADRISQLTEEVLAFAAARNWEQFHSPKNLAMALSGEVGELVEHFQWLTEDESRHLPPEKLQAVGEEVGDVLLYLVNLAARLGIDAVDCATRKQVQNGLKYPVGQAYGSRAKYSEIQRAK
ncbi:MAG: nucleotide pyrophosphohydrolase [Methylibium sp.]|uniref:nucleotide pyrophosphohydrolase n=1 Tax=Methylibium sp. TaxID=2067992 RepID=UPI0017905F99|nr:nucleotide pyrophosphohydrolase [Methylibium sp.]MBA3596801.1 nucleotide pyrophosphohydrolase [Methylibium sp.]